MIGLPIKTRDTYDSARIELRDLIFIERNRSCPRGNLSLACLESTTRMFLRESALRFETASPERRATCHDLRLLEKHKLIDVVFRR